MTKKTKLLFGMGLLLGCSWLFSGSASATTYTVTSTNDTGAGSFRQAILDANADTNTPHTINFAIPGSGQHTIGLQSNLPNIVRQVLIDGKTQPGSPLFCDATDSVEPPRVVLENASASPVWLYATYGGENTEIRGLGFGPDVAVRASEGANINCNYFGTNDGLSVSGDSQHGQPHFIIVDTDNSVITDNVFANIGGVASYFGAISSSWGSSTIQRNFFNLTATGEAITGAHYNFSALYASGGTVLFGGTNASEANTVSGYSYGVVGLDNVTALGNHIVNTGVPLRTYDSWSSPRNAPVIRSSVESGGNTTLNIELDDTYPAGTYRLEVFRNPTRRGNGFVPFDNPAADDALHGLETTELAGYVVVEKTDGAPQTFTGIIATTSVTFPTVTVTVQNPDDSFGGTSTPGYLLSNEDLTASLSTNLGAQKCFQAGTTGDWTIAVTNTGTKPTYEFTLLFRHAATSHAAESQVNFSGITATGTVTRTDYIGNYDATSGYVQGSALFWEGELLPGESVELHLPVSYSANDVYSMIVNVNSNVPADAFSGQRMNSYLQQSATAGNFQTGLVLNCVYATDLSVETKVGDAGIVPGSGGSYVITYKNEGSLDVPDKPAFSSPLNPGSMNTVSYFALDIGVTPVSASMPGVSVCSFFDPDQVGSGGPTADTSGCEVLCIDTAFISGSGFAELTEENGFGALVMCYQTIGVPAGGTRLLTLQVAADDTVSESTRFRAFFSDFFSFYGVFSSSALVPENAPFDSDVLEVMAFFQARAGFLGGTLNINPYELLAYPINNSSQLVGIAGQTTGEEPDGSDGGNGSGISPDALFPQSGALAESGFPVQLAGFAISALAALLIVRQLRYKRYVLAR